MHEDSTGGSAPRADGIVLSAEEVFLNYDDASPAKQAAAKAAAPAPVKPRWRGPGLPESLLWMGGMLGVQVVALVGMVVVLIVTHAVVSGMPVTMQTAGNAVEENYIFIMGASGAGLLLYGALAVLFRMRPHGFRKLNWRPPAFVHLMLIAGGTVPLWLLCSELGSRILEILPGSDWGMAEVLESAAAAPFPLFLLVIAVFPALAEELMFRGVIGHGLIERWGLLRGMVLTSILFGLAHLAPAQALAVIPLGFAMHYVYVTTRSFWAPIALHFLNNAYAAVLMKYGEYIPFGRAIAENDRLPPALLVISAAVVTTVAILIWQTPLRPPRARSPKCPSRRIRPPSPASRTSAKTRDCSWVRAVPCACSVSPCTSGA
jgi:uncharacterized protein